LNGLIENRAAATVGGLQMTDTASTGEKQDVLGAWTVPTSSISVDIAASNTATDDVID